MIKYSSFLLILVFSSTTFASNNWKSYHNDCNGRIKCMKAQAAAYMEFEYGEWDRSDKRYCKNNQIRPNARNYTGALRCLKGLAKDREEHQLRQKMAQTEERRSKAYDRKAEYYDRKADKLMLDNYYEDCMRTKNNTSKNRNLCAKRAKKWLKKK